jgi:hypothetical protein
MNHLTKKLASYTALSSAFLAGGVHEAEAQIHYVDLPDTKHCFRVDTINNAANEISDSDINLYKMNMLGLNILNGSTTTNPMNFSSKAIEFSFINILGQTYGTNMGLLSFDRDLLGNIDADGNLLLSDNTLNGIDRLDTGAIIGPSAAFNSGKMGALASSNYGSYTFNINANTNMLTELSFAFDSGLGPWVQANNGYSSLSGYLGFRFDTGSGNQYGWVRLTVDFSVDVSVPLGEDIFSETCITVHDYAYNTRPGRSIFAGEGQVAIPTMGQWGLIILNFLLVIFGLVAVRSDNRVVIQAKNK